MPNAIKITKANSTAQYYTQGPSGDFDQPISEPATKNPGRFGVTRRKAYAPEPAHFTISLDQFPTDLYFDPSFLWTPGIAGTLSIEQRKRFGVNMMTQWEVTDAERNSAIPGVRGLLVMTESGIHAGIEGFGYFDKTLAEYEAIVLDRVPTIGAGSTAYASIIQFNIETSNSMARDYFGTQATPFWPAWDSIKNKSTVCEFDGQTRTYQQISDQNLFGVEAATRRANRLAVLFTIARRKATGNLTLLYGSSIYQGYPDLAKVGQNTAFLLSNANVANIGGNAQGQITLNGRAYTLTSNQYKNEDFMSGYYYLQSAEFSASDWQTIFVERQSATQNYPYLWGKMKPWHIVADEKGYIQMVHEQMQLNLGAVHPHIRMDEPMYESDFASVDGVQQPCRVPFSQLQGAITFPGSTYQDTPKVWHPPYKTYGRYMVNRFMAGADGGGHYTFNTNPLFVKGDLTQMPLYNHHLHPYTARYQARMDMQPLEAWFAGSTLVENPEVQENQTGNYTAWTGPQAFGYNGGSWGVRHPSAIARYKAVAGGWEVKIVLGMYQDLDAVSTHNVRVPGLNGNVCRCSVRGPGAHLFEFLIKNSDSNQTYVADVPAAAFSKPAYSGRITI